MAPAAGGDSLHVGVNDGTPTTAANLTGFTPNEWTWSRLTMSDTHATLDLTAGGTYTLNVAMREDGLRLDKLLLITDTNTIPSGTGPAESAITTTLPALSSHTISYSYDPLYRLTAASYSGDISAGYEYVYDAVGNRTTYTATLTSTVVTTYTYNAANQLVTAKEAGSPDTWYYAYDGNGNQIRQVPNGLDPANGEVRYSYNQRNLLVQIENHDGSGYLLQAEMAYDGTGNRLQVVSLVGGAAMTTTYTLDNLNNSLPLALDDGAETRTILYGLFGLGEFGAEWRYYMGDGQLSVRQLIDGNGDVLLARSYDPFGQVLQETGEGSAIYGFMGAQSGGGGGLLYINGRYFDPATGRFLSPHTDFDPRRPGTLNGYLAALLLANPGALLFGPLLVLSRRRKGSKGYYAVLLLVGVGLGMTLVSCDAPPQPPVQSPTLPPVQPPAVGSPTPPLPVSTAPAPVTSTPPPPPPTPAIATATPTPCPTPTHAAPTSTPTLLPTATPDTSGWSVRGKQAYYSLQYISNAEFEALPWWGREPEPKELGAWILQAEGSIILGQGQQYMAEAIRYRFDLSTCGPGCPPFVAWLSGFTPFLLFPASAIPVIEAGTPLEQVVCRPCLDRLLTEPHERYKQLMYPLFEGIPHYVLLGDSPGTYWWSKEDAFTAPIVDYEVPGVASSCLYRARYELATGSYQWFGTLEQFSYAIQGGGRPLECES